MTRKCSRCLEIKHIKKFDKSITHRDGYNPICKKCIRKAEERGDDYYIEVQPEVCELV